ncbi:hypothetical protein [Wukongibacter sp. M2B1]|uniref:hypothetical protein n=1 Tax=Wukongibacter sp. M2B1 TaxID=3088895 RepID=UPI003D79B2F5
MPISRETLSNIISILLGLTGLVLAILHFATDIKVSNIALFGYIAIMTSLKGFRMIKSKKYTGYLYFIYPAFWILMVVKEFLLY